tara:strand:+ start:839 stop:1564 length:726 start_codon:yes stop_codon:yes gene_type:complete
MDSAALTSLTPLLDGIDKWVELAPLLPVIISLELVLSADNAVALASITKGLKDTKLQNKALNIGIFVSLILRILLIIFSTFILKYKFVEFICGFYLILLFLQKIISNSQEGNYQLNNKDLIFEKVSLTKIIILLAFTDLAFSIDSITAAVSISDQPLLIITGATIGVIALRFTSSLFVKWLQVFVRLEFAGFLAIALIGIKLIAKLLIPMIIIPDYIVFFSMTLIFIWGFSKKDIKDLLKE